MLDEDVEAVLRSYPRIYLACHVDHRTRRGDPKGLTSREGTLLAHLDDQQGVEPARLAKHLGVGKSALSAALTRLSGLGLITIGPHPRDGRRRLVRLTQEGRKALAGSSVLNPDRVRALLDAVPPDRRPAAVQGLLLLGAAASALLGRGTKA